MPQLKNYVVIRCYQLSNIWLPKSPLSVSVLLGKCPIFCKRTLARGSQGVKFRISQPSFCKPTGSGHNACAKNSPNRLCQPSRIVSAYEAHRCYRLPHWSQPLLRFVHPTNSKYSPKQRGWPSGILGKFQGGAMACQKHECWRIQVTAQWRTGQM